MKTVRYSGNDARRVLIGMVTDRTVCARIASQWTSEGLFSSRWENMVGTWSIKHFARYGQPIGRSIEATFETWAEKRTDEETIRLAEQFLNALSDEYDREDRLASDYLLDLAGRHFNAVQMKKLMEEVEVELEMGRVQDAAERLQAFRRVELGLGSVCSPAQEFELWADAFDAEQARSLIEFPDPFGRFVGNVFSRDSFVSITGAFGRGKSWWLQDVAFRAIRQKRRVLVIDCGDMTRRQVLKRMGQRAARRPRQTMDVKWPIRFETVDEGPIIEKRRLEAVNARKAFRAWSRMDRVGRFRLMVHSSGSLSAEQLAAHVANGEREGWVPDVIVLDYADLLALPSGMEKREGIDETWRRLRRLSQDFHCCVVTATQGDAASYRASLIRAGNFSDSRTKNDHVTAALGLNVGDEDKNRGVTRVNWLKRRDEAFSENWQIAVAGCLAIGCPLMVSCDGKGSSNSNSQITRGV